ncbi:response regulator [Aquimarina sp. AD10]|uniref:ATP-binding response regulator n=1 Tax=Aquimarina sp. AD10 TaxID=1714849 RepID=UPI000E5548E4|nr:ATP-binding protein [Aquimarina sp. AD10]AXT61470.1 response regulator [Aquimarina sp. AD10]RKM89954.1 response regulator [Aquimarina sp. AD10]
MNNQIETYQFNPQVQVTKVAYDGSIQETDTTLFNWSKGASIYDAHPFFEILKTFDEANGFDRKQELNFPCIHIEDVNAARICDLTIQPDAKHITIFLYDYTNKYRDLNRIAQQRNESILIGRELELKNKYLIEKEEFKNSFIANINHEIRTPLTSILGFVEVLEKTQLNFEQEELSRIIKRESLHLNALIDDMVDISKIESGKLKIVEERFAFQDLIDGFNETYAKVAQEKGILFETEIESSIQEYVIGDRTRVYQILNNLINNAFKFTEEGKIKFTVSKNYQRTNKLSLSFRIEDTGIGIHEENVPHLFERFTRFNHDKQITGTGLGLAIVKNLVDLLNGEIKVESVPDKGTIFNLKLPFKFEVTKNTTIERKKKKYSLPKSKNKFRILLVEDEEITQYLVMKILIAQSTYFVDIAINGEHAIKYIERRKYDLILMDLTISKLDGFQTTQMIRNNYGDKFISEVPIIGFSGKADNNARDKCIRSGMDDFIAKPFEQEELLYKITKQIAKKAAE